MEVITTKYEVSAEFERCMFEELNLHRSTDVIAVIGKGSEAVCRINGRGSGVLISRRVKKDPEKMPVAIDGCPVCPEVGVILTYPSVLPTCDAAASATATFEIPVTGHDPTEWVTHTTRLLPSIFYYSSIGENMEPSSVGYTLVACELFSLKGGVVHAVPLPLPIVKPFAQSLKQDDTCLIIQHPNGVEPRKFHLTKVASEEPHYVTHSTRTPPGYASSGGAVFNEEGLFVGIGHMSGGVHITANINDIMRHMFHSMQMKHVELDFMDEDPGLCDKFTSFGYPNDDTEVPVVRNKIFWKDVWDSWYEKNRYGTIILLLHAFPYNALLARRGLMELTCHSQRFNVQLIGKEHGVEAIVEVMKRHWDDEDVVCKAVAALSRASDTEEGLAKMEGVESCVSLLLNAVRNFAEKPLILQWCSYALANLFSVAPNPEASKDVFIEQQGLQYITRAVQTYREDVYLVKWTAQLVSAFVRSNEEIISWGCELGHHETVLELLNGQGVVAEDASCVEALVTCLHAFLDEPDFDCVRQSGRLLTEKGLPATLLSLLEHWSFKQHEGVLYHTALLMKALTAAHPPSIAVFITNNADDIIFTAHTACSSSSRLLLQCVTAAKAMGFSVQHKYEYDETLLQLY